MRLLSEVDGNRIYISLPKELLAPDFVQKSTLDSKVRKCGCKIIIGDCPNKRIERVQKRKINEQEK